MCLESFYPRALVPYSLRPLLLCGMRKQLFVVCLMQCISIGWGLSWPNLLLHIPESECIKRSLPWEAACRSAVSKEFTLYRTRRFTSSEQFGRHWKNVLSQMNSLESFSSLFLNNLPIFFRFTGKFKFVAPYYRYFRIFANPSISHSACDEQYKVGSSASYSSIHTLIAFSFLDTEFGPVTWFLRTCPS